MTPDRWEFGVAPLEQTRRLAASLRRLVDTAVSLEDAGEDVEDLIGAVDAAEERMRSRGPDDLTPRVGSAAGPGQRVYIDHARDIGAFNPCFPEYTIAVEGDVARGTVSFPVAYEGPPGLVHGGFLGVFFDCVVQHHNCDAGVAGRTTSMRVTYRRPTPLHRVLGFEVHRTAGDGRITSEAAVSLDGEVLCRAAVEAVAGDRRLLPAVSPRRDQTWH